MENKQSGRRGYGLTKKKSAPPSKKETSPPTVNKLALPTEQKEIITMPATIDQSSNRNDAALPEGFQHLVKVNPKAIHFVDAFEGDSYTMKLSIQNISKKVVTFRLQQPPAKSFTVKDGGKTLTLSSGLVMNTVVKFNCTFDSPLQTIIPIKVNSFTFNIPVTVKKGQSNLLVEPDFLDFGKVNLYSPPVYKWIRVKNEGACPVRFSVDINPFLLNISANPYKGRVKAYDSQKVRIQLLPGREGSYTTEFWVKGGFQAVRIEVQVTVVVPQLISHHPNTTGDFTLIDFPPTFIGAMRYETIVVGNESAEPSTFILLAEIRTEVLELEAAMKKNVNYNMFTVTPSEGKISPSEGKIFTCIFKPEKRTIKKGWKSAAQQKELDYLCFMRIIVVQVSDHGSEGDISGENTSGGTSKISILSPLPEKQSLVPLNSSSVAAARKTLMVKDDYMENFSLGGSNNNSLTSHNVLRAVRKTEGIRLCLHGVVVNPVLTVVPDSLQFMEIQVDREEVRVLRLTNRSSIRFGYRYKRIAFVEIMPSTEYIEPGKSLEITCKVNIRTLGNYQRRFYFELFSSKNMTDKEGLITIGKTPVMICAEVKTVTTKPKPSINFGITPKLTHEVGFLPEEVLFSSDDVDKPRNAIVPFSGGKLPKVHSKTAVIAFPNDMPKTLWGHYPDKITRTLFTGAKRYQETVDSDMTYTKEEMEKIKAHKDNFTRYMREMADKLRPKSEMALLDYDLSCEKLIQLENFKPSAIVPQPAKSFDDRSGQSLVPLTPLQLYNIKVTPRELNFEQVAVNTDCEEQMYVENVNKFLILIRILPGHSGVTIKGNKKIKVQPNATGIFNVVLHTNILGKYNGSFKYIINENHVFEMPVSGEIVQKTLLVEPEEVIFNEPKDNVFYLWYQPVMLKNPLKTATHFSWVIPDNCRCFKVRPTIGKVPSMSKMFCAVYYSPSYLMEHNTKLMLKIESGIMITVKCVVYKHKPDVFFINPVLNVGNIPLKLPTTVTTTLFNANFTEVPFEVSTKQLGPEMIILPSKGFIKPRGCVVLTLTFNVVWIGTFDRVYSVQAYDCATDLRVIGQVIFPQITISPRELRLQRVRCFSFVSYLLVAVNTSEAIAKVAFLMEKLIQFKISLSPKHWEAGLNTNGFMIKPGESQKFYLHFFPGDLATYEFYLPIKINEIIGPPLIEIPFTWKACAYLPENQQSPAAAKKKQVVTIPDQIPCVLVECTVAPARILISKTHFEFTKSSKLGMVEDELTFTNPQSNPLVFSIGAMKSASPFVLTFKNSSTTLATEKGYGADLQPGESITFIIKFDPTDYGYFEDTSLIVLKDIHKNFTKNPYNYIRFTGIYKIPSLHCSSPLVFYPTIPLQMEGLRTLYVTALDYVEDDELIIENLGKGKEMQRLTFTFIDGNTITAGAKSQISFQLAFSSLEVISFNIEVVIRDRMRRSCSFTVIAAADNCSISTHAILNTKILGLPRVKFTDLELLDSSINESNGANPVKSDESHIAHNKGSAIRVDRDSLSTSSLNKENEIPISATTPSITASLLLKQTLPTRIVQFFSVQDYFDGREHSKVVRKATEKFLFEQVFHCAYYWEIGKNVKWSTAYNPAQQGAAARNAVLIKSIIEVLERCYGKDIRTKFGQANIILPPEEGARVEKICSTLEIVLTFLKSQGACLAHVEPRYLLEYSDYVIYLKTNNIPEKTFFKCDMKIDSPNCGSKTRIGQPHCEKELTSLSRTEFDHIKAQCWMDVMLQIYKTLVLNTLPMTTKYAFPIDKDKEKLSASLKDKKGSIVRKRENLKTNISDVFKEKVNHHIYGRAEVCVLAWLNSHYDKERCSVWGPDKIPEGKIINNFVGCLSDCLVFAAVTAAYCPYITDIFFRNMYTEPQTREEKHHNAVCVTRAWQAIRIGFTVYPSDFRFPNCVLMLMLCVHLYKVLPSYLPENVVRFSTPLTTDTEHVIPLVNNSNSRNMYTIHIIGDPYQFFNIENYNPVILLKPREKHQINVRFSARKTKKVTATILICGTCISPFFGVNRVYTLEGFASELPTSIVFNLNSTLNKLTKVTLPIQSPFILGEDTIFDVWYAEKKPTTDNFEAVPWTEVSLRKAPRRLFLSASQIILNSADPSPFEIKIGCFTPKTRFFWLVFMNEHIGDFIVQISIKPKVKEMKEVVQAELADNGDVSCLCSELNMNESNSNLSAVSLNSSCPKFSWSKLLSPSCPWRTTVKIPSRNNDLWHAVKTMFELALEPSETEFWSSHLETNIGLKLVQWMVGEEVDSVTEEINHVFQTSVNYSVSSASNFIMFQPTLHIPDVREYKCVNLLAHVSPDAPDNFITKLTLTAEHKNEIRIYKLNFMKIPLQRESTS